MAVMCADSAVPATGSGLYANKIFLRVSPCPQHRLRPPRGADTILPVASLVWQRGLLAHLQGALAVSLAAGARRSAPARGDSLCHAGAGPCRAGRRALRLPRGDRCAGERRQRRRQARQFLALADRGPCGADGHLRADADSLGAVHPEPRCDLRARLHACGAHAGAPDLRASAPAVAALPSRAQDRRADPRARARPQRHRGNGAPRPQPARAGDCRGGADDRRAALDLRLALCRDPGGDGDDLHGLHHQGDGVAHRHPPQHERERFRRQRQGHRLAAEFRDGEVFRRREARDRPL